MGSSGRSDEGGGAGHGPCVPSASFFQGVFPNRGSSARSSSNSSKGRPVADHRLGSSALGTGGYGMPSEVGARALRSVPSWSTPPNRALWVVGTMGQRYAVAWVVSWEPHIQLWCHHGNAAWTSENPSAFGGRRTKCAMEWRMPNRLRPD